MRRVGRVDRKINRKGKGGGKEGHTKWRKFMILTGFFNPRGGRVKEEEEG